MTTVSRNSPCPCGSGRRYKDCCGVIAASGTRNPVGHSSPAGSGEALLLRALEAQKARDLAGAEVLYRDALKVVPNHAGVLTCLIGIDFDVITHPVGREETEHTACF